MAKREINKDLKSSPIYNMSQSSLENFHTSFLCWLGNTYPIAFKKLFNEFNDKRFDKNKEYHCETQVKHTNPNKNKDDKSIITDLEFQFNNNELIIIENKIKSYPDYDQLEKYYDIINKENKRTNSILLSLVEGNKIKLPKTWNYMSYSDLAKNMRRIFKHEKGYHKYLIQDYINVITKISNVFSEADNIEKDKYNFYKYDNDIKDKKLDINKYDLRDIFIKFRTSELANYINTKIGKKNKEWKVKNEFFNKKGVISIEKEVSISNVKFYIQIEGYQYRYAISYEKDNTKIEDISNELLTNKLWFFDIDKKNKKYCKYGSNFKYRYCKIIEDIEYKQIIKKINKDIKNFDDHLDEIKKLIAKFVK